MFLLLEVRNHGATGTFTATIETIGGEGRQLQPMPAMWDLTDSHEPFEIPKDTAASLRTYGCECIGPASLAGCSQLDLQRHFCSTPAPPTQPAMRRLRCHSWSPASSPVYIPARRAMRLNPISAVRSE
jgi:hypothetical protein